MYLYFIHYKDNEYVYINKKQMTRQKCSCMILCVYDNHSDGGWT